MKLPTRIYPAKVILFGEYTVLLGGDILAVPYTVYAAKWEVSDGEVDQRLVDYIDHLSANAMPELSLEKLTELRLSVVQGAFLESSIKVGAGLGSSGSLVAAVYDVCKVDDAATTESLLETFVKMESYFHGSSSGIDPLVSYTQSAVHKCGDQIQLVDNLKLPFFSLRDSNTPRSTQDLVTRFKQRLSDDAEFASQIDVLKALNNAIITELLGGKWQTDQLRQLSDLQLRYMPDYIPDKIKDLWKSSDSKIWKICGAGGGGYFLRFH